MIFWGTTVQFGPVRLIVEVSMSHTIRNTRTHRSERSVRLLCNSDQLLSEAAIYKTNTTDEYPCPQRDSHPRPQQSSSRRSGHKPQDQRNRLVFHVFDKILTGHYLQTLYVCDCRSRQALLWRCDAFTYKDTAFTRLFLLLLDSNEIESALGCKKNTWNRNRKLTDMIDNQEYDSRLWCYLLPSRLGAHKMYFLREQKFLRLRYWIILIIQVDIWKVQNPWNKDNF